MFWTDHAARHSVVVGCHRCGSRDLVLSAAAVARWQSAHLERAHGDDLDAADRQLVQARNATRARHARLS